MSFELITEASELKKHIGELKNRPLALYAERADRAYSELKSSIEDSLLKKHGFTKQSNYFQNGATKITLHDDGNHKLCLKRDVDGYRDLNRTFSLTLEIKEIKPTTSRFNPIPLRKAPTQEDIEILREKLKELEKFISEYEKEEFDLAKYSFRKTVVEHKKMPTRVIRAGHPRITKEKRPQHEEPPKDLSTEDIILLLES